MAEKIHHSGEHETNRVEHERTREKHNAGHEQEARPDKQRELLELARKEVSQESKPSHQIKIETEPDAPVKITPKDKNRAYKQTIGLVQAGLPKASRSFSRVIHQPTIAKVSEAAERTVARPPAILGAGLMATIGLSVMLFFARRYGFNLSGSEFILLMAVGWLIGLSVDLINQRFRRPA